VLGLIEHVGRPTITPNFTLEERVTYVMREIEDIKELLEDYDDVKWIYEVLMEYTMGLSQLETREPSADEKSDIMKWLTKLRALDPMRNGRWSDVERSLG
jgi:geranylgeranyl transferase type-2 subunit alpha